MNRDHENFEQLRRLMALKRYEVPPPGYHDRLSREISARVRALGAADKLTWYERLSWENPWMTRLLRIFDAKPAVAGVFGVAVCGLLLTAFVHSESADASSPGTVSSFETTPTPAADQLVQNGTLGLPPVPSPGIVPAAGSPMGAFAPVAPNAGSLFNPSNPNAGVERVNFSPANP